jgi:hypothetical protein
MTIATEKAIAKPTIAAIYGLIVLLLNNIGSLWLTAVIIYL